METIDCPYAWLIIPISTSHQAPSRVLAGLPLNHLRERPILGRYQD
jgi:hypothetical protein